MINNEIKLILIIFNVDRFRELRNCLIDLNKKI